MFKLIACGAIGAIGEYVQKLVEEAHRLLPGSLNNLHRTEELPALGNQLKNKAAKIKPTFRQVPTSQIDHRYDIRMSAL